MLNRDKKLIEQKFQTRMPTNSVLAKTLTCTSKKRNSKNSVKSNTNAKFYYNNQKPHCKIVLNVLTLLAVLTHSFCHMFPEQFLVT